MSEKSRPSDFSSRITQDVSMWRMVAWLEMFLYCQFYLQNSAITWCSMLRSRLHIWGLMICGLDVEILINLIFECVLYKWSYRDNGAYAWFICVLQTLCSLFSWDESWLPLTHPPAPSSFYFLTLCPRPLVGGKRSTFHITLQPWWVPWCKQEEVWSWVLVPWFVGSG